MSAFDKTIELAKRQFPEAFTVGGNLPYSDGGAPRAVIAERDEDALANVVPLIETVIPTGTEDVRDLDDGFGKLGFEVIAFYISFHLPTPQGLWGIFYFDHRVRQFAELVRREFQLKPDDAARVAIRIVRAHELFHFRFDAYALYNELILQKPLYNESKTAQQREPSIGRQLVNDCFPAGWLTQALTRSRVFLRPAGE